MSSCHSPLLADRAPQEAYPLQRDAAEHERLQAQARFWSADAAAIFETVGVAPGWRVADLGCGTLEVATLLATRVGAHGEVRAVDDDAALVERMQPVARAARVRLERGDAWNTDWPTASLDGVHARFLAAPVGRLRELLAEMLRVVRPGGVVMLQEPDASSWALPAAGQAWLELRALIREGFLRRGGCFDAGRDLAGAMRAAGLVGVERRRTVREIALQHPYAALPLAFARQLRPVLLQHELITPAELDHLTDAVAAALRGGGTAQTFTLVQAWGRKAGEAGRLTP